MSSPRNRQVRPLDLSRDEQWVVHHVMLDRMELDERGPAESDGPPVGVRRIFRKLEAGTHRFTERERQCLHEELQAYARARDTPERDQPIVRDLLVRLQQTAGDDPTIEH